LESSCWGRSRRKQKNRNENQHLVKTVSVTHPTKGTGDVLVIKRPELEAEYSPASSTEVKNAWSHTPTPDTSHCVVLKSSGTTLPICFIDYVDYRRAGLETGFSFGDHASC
jgi:hypothetical protein